MINQQELEAKIIELSLWSRGSFGKSCFYGQLLVDLSSFNWNKYDGLEQICRLRNLVARVFTIEITVKIIGYFERKLFHHHFESSRGPG